MAKIIIIKDSSSNYLQNLITSIGHTPILQSLTFSESGVIEAGTPSEVPLVLFGSINFTTEMISGILRLNALGYCIAFTVTLASVSASNSAIIQLGISSGETRLSVKDVTTYPNTILEYSEALGAVTLTPKPASTSSSLLIPNQTSLSYIPLGFSTYSTSKDEKYCFGYVPRNSVLKPVDYPSINTAAPIFHLGFLYGSDVGFNPIAGTMLKDVINFCQIQSGALYNVKGKVVDSAQQPLIRTLYAYSEANGKSLGKATSNEDGSYSIDLVTQEPVFIVCQSIGTQNSQIYSDIIPEVREE